MHDTKVVAGFVVPKYTSYPVAPATAGQLNVVPAAAMPVAPFVGAVGAPEQFGGAVIVHCQVRIAAMHRIWPCC